MKATITKCSLILVLLAIPVTGALAQPPTPEATPSPAPTATPMEQAGGPTRVGSFDWSNLADFATVLGILILGSMSAYLVRVLRPMQRREVELLQRQLECAEREKEALANVLREQKTLLEMQLRDAKEKANIPHDATLPSEPVSLDPKDRETLQQILSRLERIETVSIATGAETPPPDSWEYISEGNLRFNLQQYEQAIQNYTKALELRPDLLAALNNRGFAYNELGQYERAIQDLDRALELNPDDHKARNNRGFAYNELGQHERAIQDLDRALELKPDDHVALNNRGIAYDDLGLHERAIQDYDKGLKLKPDFPAALYNRGIAYAYLGQYERAIQDYDKSLELRPDHANTRHNMACVYSLMNKPDEALKWLREAIDLDEKLVDPAKTDPDFDNIRDDPRFKELVGE